MPSSFDKKEDRAVKNWCLWTRRWYVRSDEIFFSAGNMLQSTLNLTDLDLTDFGFNGLRILPFRKHRLLYI